MVYSVIGALIQNIIFLLPIIVFVVMSLILVIKKVKKSNIKHSFMIGYTIVTFITAMYIINLYYGITKEYTLGVLSNFAIVLMSIPIVFLVILIINKIKNRTISLNKFQKVLLTVSTALLICHVGLRAFNSAILNSKLSKYRTRDNISAYNEMIKEVKLGSRGFSSSYGHIEDGLNYSIHNYRLDSKEYLELDVNGEISVYKTESCKFDLGDIWFSGGTLDSSILSNIWNKFIHFYFHSYL